MPTAVHHDWRVLGHCSAIFGTFCEQSNSRADKSRRPESVENAKSLIYHTAHHNYSRVKAYSWGNGQTGNRSFAGKYLTDMTLVRAALKKAYLAAGDRPLLVGPDVGIGPRKGTVPANVTADTGIAALLSWLDTFTSVCGHVLDAVTWHTYDFRSTELGGADHMPESFPPPPQFGRFFSSEYRAVAGLLADNITSIV